MTEPKLPHTLEIPKLSGLNLIIEYAALLSWLVYASGLTRITGFLTSLSVPTESSSYASPTVLSYGATSLFDLIKTVVVAVVFLKIFAEEIPPRLLRIVGWTLPVIIFIELNYSFRLIGPILTRINYALFFLGATYLLLFLLTSATTRESTIRVQVLIALILFYLVAEGAGFRGDLDAYNAMNARPSVQFLLAPEIVSAAAKLGIPFSPSEAGLTEPLNVVVVSEKMFYVRIPLKLTANQVHNSERLDWVGYTTVAIPRDKVMIASAQR